MNTPVREIYLLLGNRDMIISIDETGDFSPNSDKFNFFVATHIRQSDGLFKVKERQFKNWENELPASLKNHKGEIKGSSLDCSQLRAFVENVILKSPYVGITSKRLRTVENPPSLIDKHTAIVLAGLNDKYLRMIKSGCVEAIKFKDYANWIRKLNYQQYLKISFLGSLVFDSLKNTIIHSIRERYDHELVETKFLIDRIFVRGVEQNAFWRDVLRNQFFSYSRKEPIPLLSDWKNTGHPFLTKYASKGYLDFNELFWRNCKFGDSHVNFEIRIADIIGTILSRYFNFNKCKDVFNLLEPCFMEHGKIEHVFLNDFDFNYMIGQMPFTLFENNVSGSLFFE